MKFAIVFGLVLFVLLVACSVPNPVPSSAIPSEEFWEDPLYCELDSDCMCKGVFQEGRMCFVGNKYFYQEFIDKDSECPVAEFCSGYDVDVLFVSRCFGNQCIQMPECHYDFECGEGYACVEFRCV